MTIFIEDYYEKYSDVFQIPDKSRWITLDEYKSKDFTKTQLGQYHPHFIRTYEWQNEKLSKEAGVELDLRFKQPKNKKRYHEILLADYHLALMLNAKLPCYLAFFEAYPDLNAFFIKGFCAIFLGELFHAFFFIKYLWRTIVILTTACMNAATGDNYQAADHVILAKNYFCISLMYALHTILSPVLATISFITRSAVSVHTLCADNEDMTYRHLAL